MDFARKLKQTYNVQWLSSSKKKMSNEYIVRGSELQDVSEVIRMQTILQEDGIKSNRDIWQAKGDYIIHLEYYYSNLYKDVKSKLVVAQRKNDGSLIGMGTGKIFQHNNYVPNVSGELIDIWVDPKHRRKGIATKIISELIDFFKGHNIDHITVNYIKGNQKAEAFWGSHNFRPVLETAILTIKEFENGIASRGGQLA